MHIKWHKRARQDLREIRAHITADNRKAAAKVAQTILRAIERLTEHPGSGRPGRVLDTKELVVVGTPFLVPYRITDDAIIIVRVLHGARKWPDKFDK